jgi:hypothetical protein
MAMKTLLTTRLRRKNSSNIKHCLDFITTTLPNLLLDKYDLVANITHDVPADVGREGTQRNPLEEDSYRCHVSHKATGSGMKCRI